MSPKFLLLTRLLAFSIILSVSTILCFGNKVNIGKKPDWLVKKEADPGLMTPSDGSLGGSYYMLVDVQENLSEETMFCHYVVKLLTNSGVQELSDISADFDPSFQELTFHEINRFRDGQKTNELQNHKFKVIQREPEMERHLFDGSLTAYVNLEDIREGDIIEYSYTIKGYNPIYKNNYFRTVNLEYNVPVKEIYRRLIVPGNTQLFFKYPAGEFEPVIHDKAGYLEYIWNNPDAEAHIYDNNVPSWHNDNMRVEISSLGSWSEVCNLILPSYYVSESDLNRLKDKAKKIFPVSNTDSVYLAIVRFVQDEIRYLGFESGINAYKPDPPVNVMETRYADCKAKSLLLCSLLRLYNIEAWPVLVNSDKIRFDNSPIHSPYIFNHTITMVHFKDSTFFIDPTLSNQGGFAMNQYIPDYGYGLPLKEGISGLVPVKNKVESATRVKNYFKVNAIGGEVGYKVETEYTGYYADDTRAGFLRKSLDETQQGYLKFYSNSYPLIRSASPITYTDDRMRNSFVVKEEYIIDSMWVPVDTVTKKINLEVGALIINSTASLPASPKRTMPYALPFPAHIVEDIYIDLPEEWPVSPENVKITDSLFVFFYNEEYGNNRIHLAFEYQTLSDYHKGTRFQEFYSKHEKVLDNLKYALSYTPPTGSSFSLSRTALVFFFVVISISVFFAIKIYRNYNLPGSSFGGREIGGWLFLIAIGLAVSVISVIFNLLVNNSFFDQRTWAGLPADPAIHIEFFLLVSFEFLFNSVILVYLVLLQFLFYKRRNILPRLIIILYAFNAAFLTADTLLAFSLSPESYSSEMRNEAYIELAKALIAAAIWIPYFIISKRVKETFTVTIAKAGVSSAAPD